MCGQSRIAVWFLGASALLATAGMVLCSVREVGVPPGLSAVCGVLITALSQLLPPRNGLKPAEPPSRPDPRSGPGQAP